MAEEYVNALRRIALGGITITEAMAVAEQALRAANSQCQNQNERDAIAEMVARRIAASCSGADLPRAIKASLLVFPKVTKTVRILADPATRPEDGQFARMTEAEWRRAFKHWPHSFRSDADGRCLECGEVKQHDYHCDRQEG